MFFIELNEFGWNWLTLSSTVLIALNVWQSHAYIVQSIAIWKNKSAESISLVFTSSIFFILLSNLVYGPVTQSLVLTLSGINGIICGFVMVGAWRFGSPSKYDYAIVAIGILGLLGFLLPVPVEWIFFGFTSAAAVSLSAQLWKLYQVGNRGVLKRELLITYVVKNAFFTLFAYTKGDPVLAIIGPIWLALSIWLLAKWLSLPSLEDKRAAD